MEQACERLARARADLTRLIEGWRPGPSELKDAVLLEDWIPAEDTETGTMILVGDATGHPILGDRFISTSMLIWMSPDCSIARTVSRWYRLGKRAVVAVRTDRSRPIARH